MRRRPVGPRAWIPTVLLVVALLPAAAQAQLRPLEPLDWRIFGPKRSTTAALGMAVLDDQIATLAGTRGRLVEVGNFRLQWRSNRMAMELSGTGQRRFRDDVVREAPWPGVDPADGAWRSDAGALRAAAAILLTADSTPLRVALRYGTILPKVSNEPGLDRDRTDFFATVAARWDGPGVALHTEHGITVSGTLVDGYEQNDAWMFVAGAQVELPFGAQAEAVLVGHDDLHEWTIRGNEDLREVRVGLVSGGRHWVRAAWVHGLTTFSPGRGIMIEIGTALESDVR